MNNSHTQEIQQFDQLAHSWWDPQGPVKTLHQINPLRLSFIQQHSQLVGVPTLDVGCGGGILSEGLARCGAKVTGLDLAEQLLMSARLHAHEQQLSIDYQQQAIAQHAEQQPNAYPLLTCMELLEHVPCPKTLINDCFRCVAPGGKLFFSTLNRTALAYGLAIIGAEYLLNWLPKGTHDYKKFIRPNELAQWIRQAGGNVKAITGINYQPLRKQFYLSQQVSVNYIIMAEQSA